MFCVCSNPIVCKTISRCRVTMPRTYTLCGSGTPSSISMLFDPCIFSNSHSTHDRNVAAGKGLTAKSVVLTSIQLKPRGQTLSGLDR